MNNNQAIEATTLPENEFAKLRESPLSEIPSEILAKLIEEVRNEEILNTNAYDRFHNRHNRSR